MDKKLWYEPQINTFILALFTDMPNAAITLRSDKKHFVMGAEGKNPFQLSIFPIQVISLLSTAWSCENGLYSHVHKVKASLLSSGLEGAWAVSRASGVTWGLVHQMGWAQGWSRIWHIAGPSCVLGSITECLAWCEMTKAGSRALSASHAARLWLTSVPSHGAGSEHQDFLLSALFCYTEPGGSGAGKPLAGMPAPCSKPKHGDLSPNLAAF